MFFQGYERPDGRFGIRNKVLILPASVCASDTCRLISSQVNDTVAVSNQSGCGQSPMDLKITLDTYAGFAANPNIYGTIGVTLGCDDITVDMFRDAIRKRTNKPLSILCIQDLGGTLKTIEEGSRIARQMVMEASILKTKEVPISELILGTECGGSDPTSGLAANPVLGKLSDFLVEHGGTSILSETGEILGGEHILTARMTNEEEIKKLLYWAGHFNEQFKAVGEPEFMRNLSEGNIRAGLSTSEEKSLGCIKKIGDGEIKQVLNYAECPTVRGHVFMDTPGFDAASLSGMIAGGAQICVFTTGLGSPIGNPIAPVIKMTGNYMTYNKMKDNIDFDASPALTEGKTLDEIAELLIREFMETVNGKKTKAEIYGFNEISLQRLCNFS